MPPCPQIKKIELYHDGNLVYGYEVFYAGADASARLFQVGHHIGGHLTPAVKMETLELAENENIVSLKVFWDNTVDRFEFTTD